MIAMVALTGCSSSDSEEPQVPPTPPVSKPIPISLSCAITPQATRATDYGFETNDRIGVYIVNYNDDTPGKLQLTGNHVDNMRFTYNGTWAPDTPIYWKDDKTKADFYMYYPYGSPATLESYPFSIKEDQSTAGNYKAGDFLWGKASAVAPTEKAVSITANHLFSCALISIKPGNGFTEESLATSQISVKINGLKTGASINLADGTVTATGDAKVIIPFKEDKDYKAMIIPQSVPDGNLITVTIDGREFNLKKEFTFVSGKRHTFNVTVSKTSNGVNVDIGAWEDDGTDNGGTAE